MPEPSIDNRKYCDLVAKGGITSGVVYPGAICRLAEKFTFRNIGGTSAGAIAAAIAAAAEYGRQTFNPKSFQRLKNLPQELGEKAKSGPTRLFLLFQPDTSTAKIFKICTAFLERKANRDDNPRSDTPGKMLIMQAMRGLVTATRFHMIAALIGAIPGVLIVGIGSYMYSDRFNVLTIAAGIIVAFLGAAICVVIGFIRSVVKILPQNYYGLCVGKSESGKKAKHPPLTEWLTDYLDDLAGKGAVYNNLDVRPLTFGNLWWPHLGTGESPKGYDPRRQHVIQDSDKRIRLEMMTTCLTEGRPYRLPFHDDFDIHENRKFWYKPAEFRKFFPGRIVDWMMTNARPSERAENLKTRGFYPLPDPWNLPVVVAVRMSLSFPILLSAVPLYVMTETEEPDICWFSDGGICSNFPIHFFDSPIPQWPTFGINLSDDDIKIHREAWMPNTISGNSDNRLNHFEFSYGQGGLRHAREDSEKVFGFVKAIIFTMHNWNDSTLSALPGYRERIAHVSLHKGEGGLNLDMPRTLIAALSDRGKRAADLLIERYSDNLNPEINLSNHRWVRLRTLLASMEELLVDLEQSCIDLESEGTKVESWINSNGGEIPAYRFDTRDPGNHALAQATVSALRSLSQIMRDARVPLAEGSPRPRPELRGRPRL